MSDTPYAIERQRLAAEQRTVFEQAVEQVKELARGRGLRPPTCFLSYVLGNQVVPWEDERVRHWAAKLHDHLVSAGFIPLRTSLAKSQPGGERFPDSIASYDRILLACTPEYLKRIEQLTHEADNRLVAELDQIRLRMGGREDQRNSVIPLLVSGNERFSLPLALRGRPYFDFRDDTKYFAPAFDLVLSLYGFPPNDPAVLSARSSVRKSVFGEAEMNGLEPSDQPEFDPDQLKASLVLLGERIRKEAFDAGRPVVILKNDRPTWIYPDGTGRRQLKWVPIE